MMKRVGVSRGKLLTWIVILFCSAFLHGCIDEKEQKNLDLNGAIILSDPERVRSLIRSGADPNYRINGPTGYPALMTALGFFDDCRKNHKELETKSREVIKVLLDNGADPNATLSTGRTVYQSFHLLVRPTDPEIERLLIEKGAK
jgi:hypothetical protein